MPDRDRLTPELLDAVVADVGRGVPAYRAAQARGIAKSTFYDWLRWGKEGRTPYVTLVARLEGAAPSAPTSLPPPGPAERRPPSARPNPFVGREREMARLQAGVDAACGGRGQLFLIVGEAGIGKTRLTEELGLYARDSMRALVGRCFEGEGAPPFWPWVQIVRSYVGARDAPAVLADMGAWAPDIAQIVPELHEHLAGLPPVPALDPAHARFRVFDGMTSFLTAAARREPLLLVLDDLHWADRPSLLLLAFLARALPDTRLLVVGAYRDTEVRPAHPLLPALAQLAREAVCERIVLGGLTPPDVARFIELHAGRKPSDAVAATVYAKSEGNPFFITELVRLLADDDRGEPPGEGATWHHTIPQGVRAVIARRLNRLSEDCNRILVLAAAFGREFALEPLVRVSDSSVEHTLDALDEAVRAGAVAEVAGGGDRYMFSHALVRESLYEELGAIRRTRLHRRIAEALVGVYAANPAPHYDEFAHHFFQAALGGECVVEAIDYAVRAAEYALGRLAYEQAAEHFDLALRGCALAAPDEPRRCRLYLALGDAFARASDVERGKDSFLHAAAIARQLGDANAFAAAALGFGGIVVGVGMVDETLVGVLEESLARLDERDGRLRAIVLSRLASELYFAPDVNRRARLSEEAVAMARRVDDPGALATALESRHFSLWGLADPGERLALGTEIVRLAEELNDRELLLRGHHFCITDLLEMGDIGAVDHAIAAYERLADELQQPAYWWRLRTFQAMRALMTGRFAEAEALATAALALGQRVQRQTATNFFGVQLFSLRREQGRLAELESGVRAFVESFPAVPSWRSALASLFAELGRESEARAEIEHLAADDFRDLPLDNSRLMGLTLLAEACAAVGDRKRAATLYELLLPHAAFNVVAGTAAACNGSVARPLGLLAAVLCRWDTATEHFEAALRVNGAMGARPFVARTQVEYAAMLLARAAESPLAAGEAVARAFELLGEGLRAAGELGMAGVEAKAKHLMAAAIEPRTGGPWAARARTPPVSGKGADDERVPDQDMVAVNTFRLDGEVWTLGLDGEVCRLKDARGLRYIAELLRHPHVERHALELVRLVAGPGPAAAATGTLGATTALDDESRRAYRARLHELREALGGAARSAPGRGAVRGTPTAEHPEHADELQREIDFLTRELAAGTGLGGRQRPVASDSERARVSVTRAIKLALAAIGARHAALAEHLTQFLRTGTFCCYDPPRDRRIEWQT